MNFNCLMTGVGGQGTVLASKLLAQTAICEGEFARTSETIGMAQRGGSVVSHIRIGKDCASPIIPYGRADLIIGFEPSEAVRNLSYLKKGGKCIVAKKSVQPITASLGAGCYDEKNVLQYLKERVSDVVEVDGDALCTVAGHPKTLNIILLGVALGEGYLGFSKEAFLKTIQKALPQKLWDVNLKALEIGMHYKNYLGDETICR